MKKLGLLLLLACLAQVPAHANEFLVLTVGGVNCVTTTEANLPNGGGIAVTAWQWGANTPTGPNGSEANPKGAISLNLFTFDKSTDQCTAPLLQLNLTGQHPGIVTLTQYAPSTSGLPTPSMVVTLSNPYVSTYTVCGNTNTSICGDSNDNPTEIWGLTFSKICVANKQNNTNYCYSTTP